MLIHTVPVPKIRRSGKNDADVIADIEAHSRGLPGGCRIWGGKKDKRGYGVYCYQQTSSAHRVYFALKTRKNIEGLVLRHKCGTPSCIAIEHLTPGTNASNSQDMVEKGRQKGGPNSNSISLPYLPVEALLELQSRGIAEGECLLWHNSSGRTSWKGMTWEVHRLAWRLLHGEIPKNKYVIHTCGNKRCFSLKHLRAVYPCENIRGYYD